MSVPPRLHVITARDCSAALILLRGPSDVVATIGWDRATGRFEMGQWLKGRIYEYRSDLSPDGRHFVYFAGKGGSRWWTAVSRAPWLRAIAFLPQSHTWHGGGAFTAPGEVWLNGGGTLPETAASELRLAGVSAYPHSTDGFHMGDLYAAMQVSRGWRHVSGHRYECILSRDLGDGRVLSLGFAVGQRGRGLVSSRYAIVGRDGVRQECPDWEWADLWGDRLHHVAKGALWESPASGEGAPQLVRDFTDMRFATIAAPYVGVDT